MQILQPGGYGYIWKAYDKRTREIFALKKMICQSKERLDQAKNEMAMLKKLPEHDNIVRYYGGEIMNAKQGTVAIYLMQFCDEGSLFDLMTQNQTHKFTQEFILKIIREVAEGLKCMHLLNPPLCHRDIKIENVIVRNRRYKLCDFGSCSTEIINFANIPRNMYSVHEEVFEQNTTLMYRPPEMCDPFAQYEVNEKVDVWMLGCVVYTLCFFIHPFMESSKMAIVNASYSFPQDSKFSNKLHDLIRHMLTPNPKFRPQIFQICDIIDNWNKLSSIPLNEQARELKKKEEQVDNQLKKYDKIPSKKFDGDIPMEELMKLQKKIQQQTDDPSFANENRRQREIQIKMIGHPKPNTNAPQSNNMSIQRVNAPQNEWTNFQEPQNDAFGFNSTPNILQTGGNSGGAGWGDFSFNWNSQNTSSNSGSGSNSAVNTPLAPPPSMGSNKSDNYGGGLWDMPSFKNEVPDHVAISSNNANLNGLTLNQTQSWDSSWTKTVAPQVTQSSSYQQPQYHSTPVQQISNNTPLFEDLIGIADSAPKAPPAPLNLLDLKELKF